jgi:hypothetical protein
MAVYKGNARVVQTSAGSTRSFALRADAVDSTAGGDISAFTLAAGGSIDLTYRTATTGLTAPSEATTVALAVYYETGDGLLIKILHNTTPPANGTVFTFYATDTGELGGSPRSGTLRLYVFASRSGVGAYDGNSDNNGDQGVLRANAKVTNLSVSAYSAGATFAYGVAGNENFTLTATHTQCYEIRGHENTRIDVIELTDQQVAGATKNIGSGTTTSEVFTVNTEFDDATKSYGAGFFAVGAAQLVPDSEPDMLWTSFVDESADVEQDGDNVRRQSFYNVDPRYYLSAAALGEAVYQRYENAVHSFGLTNARGEDLTRLVTWNILDGNGDVVASVDDTGPTYSNTRAVGDIDRATNDTSGDPWSILITLVDAYNKAGDIYNVSRYWKIRQSAGADVGTVFTNKTHSPGADSKILFNRGQNMFFVGLLYNARDELLGAVDGFFAPRRTDQEAYELGLVAYSLTAGGAITGAGAVYTVPITSVISPAGRALVYSSDNTVQPRSGTGGVGNFAETNIVTPEWTVTDHFNVYPRLQKLPTFNSNPQSVVFTIGDEAIYMMALVTDAVGDVVEGVLVLKKQIDPVGIESGTGQGTTQADGRTLAISFQPNTPKGDWIYRATVSYNGNTGTADQTASHVSAFTANKDTSSGFGPVAGVPNTVANRQTSAKGDFAKPGDRILLGMGFTEFGIRVVITQAPEFQLAHFNQATARLEILQSDYTWKSINEVGYEPHFFVYKYKIDSDLEWVTSFGTAEQGVTVENGYVTDTADWEPGSIYTVNRTLFEGQNFITGNNHQLVGPSGMNAMDIDDIPGLLVKRLLSPSGIYR